MVVNPFFDWNLDRPPRTPYHETVIYEAHVRGLTMEHPVIPDEQRGTYLGLAHPAVISHLKGLGVTAVELMPVHQFVTDSHLNEKGLANYWGYNTIGFFAPHNGYSASGSRGEQVQEFKTMVRALHAGGHRGDPRRGLQPHRRGQPPGARRCPSAASTTPPTTGWSTTTSATTWTPPGTGNSLLMRHPHVLQMIMDSLRYWVLDMHVDGFRFDLAATLARQFYEVDRLSAFFDLVQQDPVVSQVKLIAEPWDVGDGGYQVGNFPPLWTEWNGKYRDTIRDFWRGQPATLPEFASRLTGSSDLYQQRQPAPGRLDQLRHLPRRVHPDRPGLLQPQAQRGQRRGRPGRHRRQPVLELRRRGPDRGQGHPRAAGQAEAQLPGHAAAVAGRADAAGRRRAGPHPAGQQQRLLPGQRDVLGGLGGAGRGRPGAARVRPRA